MRNNKNKEEKRKENRKARVGLSVCQTEWTCYPKEDASVTTVLAHTHSLGKYAGAAAAALVEKDRDG